MSAALENALKKGLELHHDGRFEDAATLYREVLERAPDHAAARLAGGLGKPVWTLLAFAADWRWGLASGDTPWYPSMRLFRQSRAGDWSTVMQDVAGALANVSADAEKGLADGA